MKKILLLALWIGLSANASGYHEFRIEPAFADDSLKKQADSTYTVKTEPSRLWGGLAMVSSIVPYLVLGANTFDPLPAIFISFLVTVISGIIAFTRRKKLLRTKYKDQPNARRLPLGQWSAGIGLGLWGLLIIGFLVVLSRWQ